MLVDQENVLKAKRSFRKVNISPVDVRREEDASLKAETPGSGAGISSEHYAILEKFDSLTGDAHRDKCLGKLLEAVQHICYIPENKQAGDEAKVGSDASHLEQDEKDTKPENGKVLAKRFNHFYHAKYSPSSYSHLSHFFLPKLTKLPAI